MRFPKIDWTVGIGTLVGWAVGAPTVAISAGILIWNVSAIYKQNETRMSRIEERLVEVTQQLKTQQAETTAQFKAVADEAASRQSTYGPLISTMQRADDIRDERLGALGESFRALRIETSEAFKHLRADLSDSNKNSANLREAVAGLTVELRQRRAP